MNYGIQLRYLREEKELSQIYIANLLKIDHTQYCHYENETRIIPIKHLNTLCNFYKVSIDYIFKFNKELTYKDLKEDINKALSSTRLKEFRKENKLTQEKLAKLLNTSHSVISSYEKNNTLISTGYLYTICKKYNISADYLLGKIDNPMKL